MRHEHVISNNIKAIETTYAGCRFRSRLEARWAVFLDTLGIRWEYEPQAVELSWRLNLGDAPLNYLPDFYLPDLDTWAEVKGAWNDAECDRFLNAAAALCGAGGCTDGTVVLFGHLPNPGDEWAPVAFHMHKGDLNVYPWAGGSHYSGGSPCGWRDTIARDIGGDDGEPYSEVGYTLASLRPFLLGGWPHLPRHEPQWQHRAARCREPWNIDTRYALAVGAARSARFGW
jgi:hypothetical protein